LPSKREGSFAGTRVSGKDAPIPPVREGGDRATAIDPEPTFMAAPWIVAAAWTRTFAPAAESITEAI
jgi:hypothetical protein